LDRHWRQTLVPVFCARMVIMFILCARAGLLGHPFYNVEGWLEGRDYLVIFERRAGHHVSCRCCALVRLLSAQPKARR
jgi:hypothetical protein